MILRQYAYVGPANIKQRAKREKHCVQITAISDIVHWTVPFLPTGRTRGSITATFVIDIAEKIWIADRRSEHVACADGQDVLAAGEIVFERAGNRIEISEITNQSTGYCPEPSCWGTVSKALTHLGIAHPSFFTAAFEFRRCDQCAATNLIKDDVFDCAVCNAPLSQSWNYLPLL